MGPAVCRLAIAGLKEALATCSRSSRAAARLCFAFNRFGAAALARSASTASGLSHRARRSQAASKMLSAGLRARKALSARTKLPRPCRVARLCFKCASRRSKQLRACSRTRLGRPASLVLKRHGFPLQPWQSAVLPRRPAGLLRVDGRFPTQVNDPYGTTYRDNVTIVHLSTLHWPQRYIMRTYIYKSTPQPPPPHAPIEAARAFFISHHTLHPSQ